MKRFKELLQPSLLKTTLLQLSFFLSLYLAIVSNANISWWVFAFIAFCLYTMIGNNLGMHRYFSHDQFEASKPVEYILLWFASMIGFGSPINYAVTHLVHHKYPDTEYDPHGPTRGYKSFLWYFHHVPNLTESPIFTRRIVELHRKYQWVHDYYLLFIVVNALIFLLIDYRLFLFGWLLPIGFTLNVMAYSVWRQHTGFKPVNDWFHWFDILNEGLHKNHHEYPSAPNNAFRKGEIDWTYLFSKLFFLKYKWKGQPTKQD